MLSRTTCRPIQTNSLSQTHNHTRHDPKSTNLVNFTEEWLTRELNSELLDHQFKDCSGCLKELPLRLFSLGSSKCQSCVSMASREKREANPAKSAWERARARAKKSGTEFSITLEDVIAVWTNTCPIYQIPLKTNKGKSGADSHSIDRIDNSKGYVPGNIAIVSMRFNTEKRNLSPELLRRMLAYMDGRLLP